MREGLDQWPFVLAAYGVTVCVLALLIGWSVLSMQAAERRRKESRSDRAARR